MAVACGEAVAMIYVDDIAVTVLTARNGHRAAGGGDNGRSREGFDVLAFM